MSLNLLMMKKIPLQYQGFCCYFLLLVAFIALVPQSNASDINKKITLTNKHAEPEKSKERLPLLPKPFLAEYKTYYKWLKMGEVSYQFSKSDEQPFFKLPEFNTPIYRFALESKMRFLLFTDRRQVESDFYLKQGLLYPYKYKHKRQGTGEEYQEQLKIDWENRRVNAQFHKHQYELNLNSDEISGEDQAAYSSYKHVLDGLAVQFQLFLDIRQQQQSADVIYPILEASGLMERSFEFVENQTIELKVNGEKKILDCVVFKVNRHKKKFRTLMFFAKQLDYLPVQLVHYTNGKKQFSATLFEFKYTE